jgi:hypothetical protein
MSFFSRIESFFTHRHTIAASAVPVTPPVSIPVSPYPVSGKFPTIALGTISGCTPDEELMVQAAFRDLNTVVAQPLFLQLVLANLMTENQGLTQQGIYDLHISKSPIVVNFTMFTGSFMQNHVYETMGYEDPNYPGTCFCNRYFVKDKETCGSLILHETGHVIGFTHYQVMATSEPYTMNWIYDQVAQSIGLEPKTS